MAMDQNPRFTPLGCWALRATMISLPFSLMQPACALVRMHLLRMSSMPPAIYFHFIRTSSNARTQKLSLNQQKKWNRLLKRFHLLRGSGVGRSYSLLLANGLIALGYRHVTISALALFIYLNPMSWVRVIITNSPPNFAIEQSLASTGVMGTHDLMSRNDSIKNSPSSNTWGTSPIS